MTTDQQRAEFERLISGPPHLKNIYRFSDDYVNKMLRGKYADKFPNEAWEIFQHAFNLGRQSAIEELENARLTSIVDAANSFPVKLTMDGHLESAKSFKQSASFLRTKTKQ